MSSKEDSKIDTVIADVDRRIEKILDNLLASAKHRLMLEKRAGKQLVLN